MLGGAFCYASTVWWQDGAGWPWAERYLPEYKMAICLSLFNITANLKKWNQGNKSYENHELLYYDIRQTELWLQFLYSSDQLGKDCKDIIFLGHLAEASIRPFSWKLKGLFWTQKRIFKGCMSLAWEEIIFQTNNGWHTCLLVYFINVSFYFLQSVIITGSEKEVNT
jgi:hypothetical protein